jgi:long-chain acyl-CoA synthetase
MMSGAALDTIAELIGGPRTDDVLRRAARQAPDRTALVSPAGELSYAELDEQVTWLAATLRELVGGPGTVIALTAALDQSFALGYFAIARSGNVSALINPLLHGAGLAHVLSTSAAELAIVTPQVYARLAGIRDRLPDLHTVVLTEPDPECRFGELPTLDGLSSANVGGQIPAGTPGEDEGRIACLQFTSGTTGAPKAAQLSHRNLTINAAQVAHTHQLSGRSVIVNYLPTFHLMHLTAGVAAAATHVLCTDPNPAVAMEVANRYRATHFYSLPVRLSRLAVDVRLLELEVPTLRAVLSGGSSLPQQATVALTQQLGVPVIQGYGLAETSPLTHCDLIDQPRLRSSGPLVPGSEARIVQVESRSTLPVGVRGEIQVRGPQLMQGYLGRDLAQDLDEDGWFSTGDIGYVDTDGYLFVVDRIKDVFKCDNWLVSPTEIERVVLRHPQVADCVVVDYPDEFSGAVAYGLVVRHSVDLDQDELTEFVASKLPYYEHLRHVEFVDSIPRSPNGKVQRRVLRDQVRARAVPV